MIASSQTVILLMSHLDWIATERPWFIVVFLMNPINCNLYRNHLSIFKQNLEQISCCSSLFQLVNTITAVIVTVVAARETPMTLICIQVVAVCCCRDHHSWDVIIYSCIVVNLVGGWMCDGSGGGGVVWIRRHGTILHIVICSICSVVVLFQKCECVWVWVWIISPRMVHVVFW